MTRGGLLEARYELRGVLGRGGMADVWQGLDHRLGRTVAVKILRPNLATDPGFRERFHREAQSVAALNHPAIVAVYDTGVEDSGGVSIPYIVMEYVEGRTLREALRQDGRVLPERALEITSAVLGALSYSHRAGIVHRDIKPANIMLTPSGAAKVMDFGIARAIADGSSRLTRTATVIGTAHYLSPEQARGRPVDARSDVYSTGCMLYELLTGRPPFEGDSSLAVAYQHVQEEPPSPQEVDPDVPPAPAAIALRALEKRPERRYQGAAEMDADIRAVLAGDTDLAEDEPVGAGVPLLRGPGVPTTGAADDPARHPGDFDTAQTAAVATDLPKQASRKPTYVLFSAATIVVLAMVIIGATQLARHGFPTIVPPFGESGQDAGKEEPGTKPSARPAGDSTDRARDEDGRVRTQDDGRSPAPKETVPGDADPQRTTPDPDEPTDKPTSSSKPSPPEGSPRPSDTPEPSETPDPTESPDPTETPEPTDDPTTPPPVGAPDDVTS